MKDILHMLTLVHECDYLGLKLVEVTWSRKLSICLKERALCKVSRGLIVGVPSSPTKISTVTYEAYQIYTTHCFCRYFQVPG